MTIEKLLEEIGEDKHQNPATTSNKFKTDLWNFCKSIENSNTWNCVEYGTHKGQSLKILSKLFNHVYTINLPNHFDAAMQLNSESTNITYVGMDLYTTDIYDKITEKIVNLFFIDAVHTYDAVLSDFTRSINLNCSDECYFVFDDYGLIPDVKRAVEDLIQIGKLKVIMSIGHEPGYNFKNGRTLSDWEGIICQIQ